MLLLNIFYSLSYHVSGLTSREFFLCLVFFFLFPPKTFSNDFSEYRRTWVFWYKTSIELHVILRKISFVQLFYKYTGCPLKKKSIFMPLNVESTAEKMASRCNTLNITSTVKLLTVQCPCCVKIGVRVPQKLCKNKKNSQLQSCTYLYIIAKNRTGTLFICLFTNLDDSVTS